MTLFVAFIYFRSIILVSGFKSLSDIYSSNLNNSQLVSYLIAEQREICPYIALCHTPNSTVYKWDANKILAPCCKECFCEASCVEDDTCCPDYFNTDITKTEGNQLEIQTNDTFGTSRRLPINIPRLTKRAEKLQLTNDNDNASLTRNRLGCVKVQHGPLADQNAYFMISSCPSNFDDAVVKNKCEMKLHYSAPFNIIDHRPVSFSDQGQTYKNRFCAQCNLRGVYSVPTFWHISLLCEFQYFIFDYFPLKNQIQLVEKAVFDGVTRCDVIYKYETSNMSVVIPPKVCKYDTVIHTCDEENTNAVLQTLCEEYFWPIEAVVSLEKKLYKNYACILCNGIRFRHHCPANNEILVSVELTSTLEKNDILKTNEEIINRYFPNKNGTVYCKKGFVYDAKKVPNLAKYVYNYAYFHCTCTY